LRLHQALPISRSIPEKKRAPVGAPLLLGKNYGQEQVIIDPTINTQVRAVFVWVAEPLQPAGGPATDAAVSVTFTDGANP